MRSRRKGFEVEGLMLARISDQRRGTFLHRAGYSKLCMRDYCPPLPRPPRADLGDGAASAPDAPGVGEAAEPPPPRPLRGGRGAGAAFASDDVAATGGAVAGRGEDD
jgi:hypothetical protein